MWIVFKHKWHKSKMYIHIRFILILIFIVIESDYKTFSVIDMQFNDNVLLLLNYCFDRSIEKRKLSKCPIPVKIYNIRFILHFIFFKSKIYYYTCRKIVLLSKNRWHFSFYTRYITGIMLYQNFHSESLIDLLVTLNYGKRIFPIKRHIWASDKWK